MHPRLHSPSLPLLLSLLFPALACSQPLAPELVELDPLHVTALLPDDLARLPGAGSVLLHEDIERLRPFNLHEAADHVPGLRAIDDDAAGRRSGIGLRAAPARRSRKVLLLEDGMPVNAATYLDPSAHYTPPLERIERVEVLKGAGQVRHAPIHQHGVVNFRNLRPGPRPETVVRASAGELDTRRFHARHSRREGTFGFLLSYTAARADGSFDLEHTSYDDLHGAFEWTASPDDRLTLDLTWFRERSRYDESNLTPAEYAAAPRTKRGRFGQEHNAFAFDLGRARLGHHHDLASGLTLDTTAFAQVIDRPRVTVDAGDSPVALLPALAPDDPFDPAAGSGHMLGRLRRYRAFALETLLSASAERPGDRPTWLVGLRADRQFLDDRRSAGVPGVVVAPSSPGPITRHEAYQASAAATFAERTWRRGDWALSAGTRVEHYTQSKLRRTLAADPGPHPDREKDRHTLLLPTLGLLHDGLPDTELYAQLGRGYMPAIARTAEDFPLRPETGVTGQLGARTRALPVFDLEGAVFGGHFSDTIVHLPYTTNDQNVFLNAADSRAAGLDLALRLRSSAPVRPVLALAYNLTIARFTGGPADGNDVPEVPRHTGSLTLGLERPSRWHASLTLSHLDAFFTDPANTRPFTLADEDGALLGPDDAFEVREPVVLGRVPSHTVLSARVSATTRDDRLTAWIEGRNLTDKLYVADLENGVRPGPARTVLAGVEVRF